MPAIKFGTDGWRSRIDADFTAPNVRRVAKAVSEYLHETKQSDRGIFIGYDGRLGSATFARECAGILADGGIMCFLPPRPVPTPIAAFAAASYSLAGAVMITASHNPPAYNGIKYIPHYGGPATEDITAAIERLIPPSTKDAPDFDSLSSQGMIAEMDPIDDYLKRVEGYIESPMRKIKVTIDPMHGATSGIIDRLLSDLGLEVEVIRGTIDPNFGGITPDPVPSNLGALRERALKNGSEVAFAMDGDGDRITAVTGKGEFLPANKLLPVIYLHMLEGRVIVGDAARTVATSHLIDAVANSKGKSVIVTPVGFKYIGELLRNRKVVVGGEESGGISFSMHIPEKDGMASAILVLEAISMSNGTLSGIMDRLKSSFGEFVSLRSDISIEGSTDGLLESIARAASSYRWGKRVAKTDKLDGFKILFDDGSWLLYRVSGTESAIRVYAESSTIRGAEMLMDLGKALLSTVRD
ncbi:MAG: phosphoglucomutase/phosphomannomutase family protein [Candidatus Methanomethylicia archaeon]|nr:phosphoglucomutase/phosphomannomutase family protein [Candidatus Methanomethylicia archaeon]